MFLLFICSKMLFVKSLIKTLFIFLCFFILHGISTPCEISSPENYNYIQNDYQKIVLTSEIIRADEVIGNSSNNNNNSSLNKNFETHSCSLSNISLSNKNSHILMRGIHNLSTCLKSEISIRAP